MATYEIIIRNGTGGGGDRTSAPTTESTGVKKPPTNAGKAAGKGEDAFKPSAAYGIAKRAVTMGVNHMVNTVNLRTGHAELQQRYQMINDIASRTFGIVESIAAGALVGGGVGAAVGAVTGLAFQGVQIAQQLQERQWRMQEESVGISLMTIRAGLGRQAR